MLSFPDGFVWGCATASYQIEGSPLADGAGPSIWHRFSHTPGNTRNGDTGDVAADHYRRYREDVSLMKELGLHGYRFSISWPRVFPEGTGQINEAGLAFYDRLVDALLEAGITPFVTIYHWDLPGALQDLGGWTNREVADWFAQYAMALFLRLGDRVKHWMTINEPWMVMEAGHVRGFHAPGIRDMWAGLRAAHNMLLAHARAVRAYRACGGEGQIGIAVNMGPQQPASRSREDEAAAERAHAYMNRFFLDPIFRGCYAEDLMEWFGEAWPDVPEGDMVEIRTPVDFLGINYYTRRVVAHKPGAGPVHAEAVRQNTPHTARDLEIYPEGLYQILSWVRETYDNPILYVTENGAAFDDRVTPAGEVEDYARIEYLRQHLAQAHRAIQEGANLKGYFVWNLMDDYAWNLGYSMRYGLFRVAPGTQQRTMKRSGKWYSRAIARNGILDAV